MWKMISLQAYIVYHAGQNCEVKEKKRKLINYCLMWLAWQNVSLQLWSTEEEILEGMVGDIWNPLDHDG